ncbi:MAG: hypothetical protein ACFFE8_13765 [Candidatus Heimdallarchaeota archaeon]
MATREEKQVRLELPSTSGVECEIHESLKRDEYVLKFYQNERLIKTSTLTGPFVQDTLVELLSEAEIEFFSFSAIFDVADLLLEHIKAFRELDLGDDSRSVTSEKPQPPIQEAKKITKEKHPAEMVGTPSPQVASVPVKKQLVEYGDKLLHKFEMPYSRNGEAGIYHTKDGKYAVVLFDGEKQVVRKKYTRDSVNQDDLVNMITKAGIEFLSFSAIYESAEKIEKTIQNPGEFLEEIGEIETTSSDMTEGVTADRAKEFEVAEAELAMVDLSAFDTSKFKNANDLDRFVAELTDFVSKGQPIPIKEIPIEKSGRTIFVVYRQLDRWFALFKYRDGTSSDLQEVEIDHDAIAKLINQNVPQISFSILYDESEKIQKVMEQLAQRPISDIVLNVAMGHFLKVIEGYEKEGNLKEAVKGTEVLFERARKEQNATGLLQFGKKLIHYYDRQKKTSKAGKFRNQLTEDLLEVDKNIAYEFVESSLDPLAEQEKFLIAANLCGLLLDRYLIEEGSLDVIAPVLNLGKKQIDLYKKARLQTVQWENAVRYAHFAIEQLGKAEPETIPREQRETYNKDIVYLLDVAFEVQEEQKQYFELMESIEKTLQFLKESKNKDTYTKYVDRFILTAENQNKREKALEVALEASRYLLDATNYRKACNLGNQAIKLFYELKRVDDAVDFSLDIVRGLITLREAEAARNYLKFAESLIDQAYANEETKRIEKQLTLGDLFGKLGDRAHSKSYIQKALQTIRDPKERQEIIFNYVDELLSSKAILTAQEMANLELARLLDEQKITEVSEFCIKFITKLKAVGEHNMAWDYMKYLASLMFQTEVVNYELLLDFVKDLLKLNAVDHAAYMLDQLEALQLKNKDYTRAIDNLSRFVEHLLNETDRFDLVEKYTHKISETYRAMGDPEGAIERLLVFQEEILEKSIDLAQKITDEILKELESKEDYQKAIDLVSRIINKQIEQERYQDAYIFSVQNARYLESLGSIDEVVGYLESVRNKFIEKAQYENSDRMTDLILRFGRGHKRYPLVIASVKKYLDKVRERGDSVAITRFTLEMAKLLEEAGKGSESLKTLQMVFNQIYESDKANALNILRRILKLREDSDDFKKIASRYLIPLVEEHPDPEVIDTIKQTLSPSFDEFTAFSENFYDKLIKSGSLSEEMGENLVDFVMSVYMEGSGVEGDRLSEKYTSILLEADLISSASRLMSGMLENTEKSLVDMLPSAFGFIKGLISRTLLEGAREFTDRIIRTITNQERFGHEGRLLAAKIAEKFTLYVAAENPDLASEYAYQASDFYRSINDFEGVLNVYTSLADEVASPRQAIRTLQRGITLCEKYNANKHAALLQAKMTEFLMRIKDQKAGSSFQKALEKLEGVEDFELLFNTVVRLLKEGIAADNVTLVKSYVDYACRLGGMINTGEKLGGILVFLSRYAKRSNDADLEASVENYLSEFEIKARKYKKEYTELEKKRLAYESVEEEEITAPEAAEIREEFVAPPELVETSEFLSPSLQVPPESSELSEEFLKEEVAEEVAGIVEESIVMKSVPEVSDSPEPEIPEVDSSILPPPEDKIETSTQTSLSQEEAMSLFPQEHRIEDQTPAEDRPVRLTDEDVESLFAPVASDSPSMDSEPIPDLGTLEEPQVSSEEWKVDVFGRLIRKEAEPIPEEEKETTSPSIEAPPAEAIPDLTPLEILIHEEESARKHAEEVSIPPEEIVETQAEPGESPFSSQTTSLPVTSIMDALSEDEMSGDKDIFSIPEVSYEEIPDKVPEEKLSEAPAVQPPSLTDMFSDALSELGGISGKTGEKAKKKDED